MEKGRPVSSCAVLSAASVEKKAVFVYGTCASAACSKLLGVGFMEKNTRTQNAAAWKATVEEAASLILRHSIDRMLKVKEPYQPEHKAYMALAVAIDEAIKAFIALDESLK